MRGHANLLRLWFKVENVGDVPASCAIMKRVLDEFHLRFPDQQYIIIDNELTGDEPVVIVETVPGTKEVKLWEWDSADEGYGDICEVTFPHGQGLIFSYGGSPANSAFSIFVVPLQISADGWVTATPVRQRRR